MPIFKDGELPPVRTLYKYMKPKHVDGAVSDGRFHIGTLYEYRNAEKYPGAQLDRDEGKMLIDGEIGTYRSEDGHEPPPLMNQLFGPAMKSAKNVTVERVIVENFHDQMPNYYIFCAAHQFNEDIYNRNEYGAAVRITDEFAFCREMSVHLCSLGIIPNAEAISQAIEYRDRKYNFTYDKGNTTESSNLPWFLVKPDNYSNEFEWRFVWNIGSLQENLIVTCPAAAEFVEAFEP